MAETLELPPGCKVLHRDQDVLVLRLPRPSKPAPPSVAERRAARDAERHERDLENARAIAAALREQGPAKPAAAYNRAGLSSSPGYRAIAVGEAAGLLERRLNGLLFPVEGGTE